MVGKGVNSVAEFSARLKFLRHGGGRRQSQILATCETATLGDGMRPLGVSAPGEQDARRERKFKGQGQAGSGWNNEGEEVQPQTELEAP